MNGSTAFLASSWARQLEDNLKRKRGEESWQKRAFFRDHTNPLVRVIVWQSHYLSDRAVAKSKCAGCLETPHWLDSRR